MRVPRLYYCMVIGFVIAALVSFVFGTTGVSAYQQLRAHEQRLQDNIESLQARNATLERRLAALRSNRELMRLHARELGYYQPDEVVVRISGAEQDAAPLQRTEYPPTFYAVGALIRPIVVASYERYNMLAMAMAFTGVLYLLTTVVALVRRGAAAQPAVDAAGSTMSARGRSARRSEGASRSP